MPINAVSCAVAAMTLLLESREGPPGKPDRPVAERTPEMNQSKGRAAVGGEVQGMPEASGLPREPPDRLLHGAGPLYRRKEMPNESHPEDGRRE
jgi:hypothetical protein